jgi:transposase
VAGESKRSILREYGIHFETLQKILAHSEPPGYRQREPRKKRKIGPYLSIIDDILTQDRQAPRKQRHTAKRLFDRLKSEYGYAGGYTSVKEAVRSFRQRQSEVFMPLGHRPGEAQVDFGFAMIDWNGIREKVALFVMSLPYSDAFFICAFPRECTEAFQMGHYLAFEFFGAVPWRISYDNSKVAVSKIVGKRRRELTKGFLRLQSHFLFDEHFCLVRRANEKGHVESLVGYGRRNFMVPVPRVSTLGDLNAHLQERCRAELSRQLRGKEKTKGELLEEERACMLSIPKHRFEARRIEKVRASSLSLVRFDRNDYSVPTAYAHHPVTAVGSIDEVKLVVDDRLVARHERCWKKHKVRFDPVHYLALLERKPGALDFARPLQKWELPECFGVLRRRLESALGDGGTREYIKVLRILEKVSLGMLTRAVHRALSIGATSSDAIRLIALYQIEAPVGLFCLDGRPHLKSVKLQNIDLSSYGTLTAETGR